MCIPADITDMIERGALVAINHSGGKDSQAMTIRLVEAGIPRNQLLIVHATLGDVEWPGTISHIRKTTFGLPLVIARPRRSFFEMVRAAGKPIVAIARSSYCTAIASRFALLMTVPNSSCLMSAGRRLSSVAQEK